jgi:hypothetical protein
MAEGDIFNVDFNQISDQTEGIDLSEVLSESAEQPSGDEVVIKDTESISNTISPESKEEKEEPGVKDQAPPLLEIEVEDENTTIKDKGPGTEGKASPITPFATFLQEKGFLPNLDMEAFEDEEDPMDALAQAWGNERAIMRDDLINSFPPELIDMARAVAEGVPLESLRNDKVKEINYSRITQAQVEGNTHLQKRLVGEFLQTKGFKPEKIKTLVDTYEDAGRLSEEATDALGEMKVVFKQYQENTKQQYAQQQRQFQQQHSDRIKHIGATIKQTDAIIPGINLTEKSKRDLFNNMTQIVGQDENGQPLPYVMALRQEDPLQFDMAVTFLAQTTKGFTDWSKLNKVAKTNATKDLATALNHTPNRTGGASKKVNAPFAEEDLMSSLSNMFGKT